MKKIVFILASALLSCTVLSAQNLEQIYTNNGIYYGYISRQPVSGSDLQFSAERRKLTMPADSASIVRERVNYENLPGSMQDWLYETKGISSGDIDVATITIDGKAYYNAYIINAGTSLSFMTFDRRIENIPYDDILHIARTPVSLDDTEGIVTLIEMADGRLFKGQIIDQYPGNSISFQSEGSYIQTLAYQDISAIRYEPIDHSKSIFEQTPLLDCIVMKSGARYTGVVTARNLITGQITLQGQRSEYPTQFNGADISAFEKTPVNYEIKDSKPAKVVSDVVVGDVPTSFNETTTIEETVYISRRKTTIVKHTIVTTPVEDLLVVEAVDGVVNLDFKTLVRSSKVSVKAASEYKASESKFGKTKTVVYPMVSSDSSKSDYDLSQDGDRTFMDITFAQDGLYVICFEDKDECIAFNVKIVKARSR